MNEQDQTRDAQLAEMKSFLEAKVKAEPENAEAWRELAQVKMMEGDIGLPFDDAYAIALQMQNRGTDRT